jgi:hypothetical protein
MLLFFVKSYVNQTKKTNQKLHICCPDGTASLREDIFALEAQ